MASKSSAALTTDNNNKLVNQTTPESVTPTTLGGQVQDLIDSSYNRTDDLLLPKPIELTKALLLAAIAGNALFDKQWIKITDRSDGFPLFVCAQGTNTLSPFGIQVKGGIPLAVVMDYINGFDGEIDPFIAIFDENRKLNLSEQIIIADGSEGDGKMLVSDANGGSSWQTKILTVTAAIDIPSLAPGVNYTVGVSFPGVIDGDVIAIGIPKAVGAPASGQIFFTASYSSANLILFTAQNTGTTLTYDLPLADFKFAIIR